MKTIQAIPTWFKEQSVAAKTSTKFSVYA
jgi:hypothetical protein